MAKPQLRAHQREAVDSVVRALEPPADGRLPERGLRTQVIMATGSGKSLVAVRAAEELRAGRVLVLVPSLDLLVQTVSAWRAGAAPAAPSRCARCAARRRDCRPPPIRANWPGGAPGRWSG